ncbi:hypothetical protein K469DRAFT_686950 [Zopfia rhizophila CBS 207.26]|uniref:Uncharacterized protein n=1 Tax=Zopfia rhizophila CBS 207.26 TaxID=1314779 RepID=A0A6A6E3U6_9PEZI|nr:hypothetical protein K469DRAFT_686950 [Zopfia rhizophila CBS 207.26]
MPRKEYPSSSIDNAGNEKRTRIFFPRPPPTSIPSSRRAQTQYRVLLTRDKAGTYPNSRNANYQIPTLRTVGIKGNKEIRDGFITSFGSSKLASWYICPQRQRTCKRETPSNGRARVSLACSMESVLEAEDSLVVMIIRALVKRNGVNEPVLKRSDAIGGFFKPVPSWLS